MNQAGEGEWKHDSIPTYPHGIVCYMTADELALLERTAADLCEGGLIVEIGACYGGSTATLALAAPQALVLSIDTFGWSPVEAMPASAAQLLTNMAGAGAGNVAVLPADSHAVGAVWSRPIDLLFVDGGHDDASVRGDLAAFGPHAGTVAVHDYGNPYYADVEQAAADFCADHGFVLASRVDYLAILVRV